MTRRNARKESLFIMFELCFEGSASVEETIQNAIEAREAEFDDFAKKLAQLAWDNLAMLDALIEKHSDNWKLNRLPRIVVSILRLALTEMLFIEDVPISVSINEAVEIAKIYGGEDDWSFINGVLGSIAKADAADAPKTEAAKALESKIADAPETDASDAPKAEEA